MPGVTLGWLVGLALGLGLLTGAWAETPAAPDARILIDVSGSMKQTDPDNLRQPALRLLVGLLPSGARAGVWNFAQQVSLQVPLTTVNDGWRDRARAAAGQIHSRGLFTHVEEALKRASADWQGPPKGFQRHLVLLTDGMVDVSKDPADSAASRDRILTQLLPRLRELGVKIHTVALSDRADHALMRQLSEASGGWYEQVANADQLQRVFLRIFEKVGNPDTLPLKDNRFQVDGRVQELTLLVFHPKDAAPTRLIQPNGQELSAEASSAKLTWHRDQGYDLITVREPMAGEWRIQAQEDPDNRALVLTDLRMEVGSLPERLVAGQAVPLEVRFLDQDQPLNRKTFIDVMRVTATQVGPGGAASGDLTLGDNGQGDDTQAYDGKFQARFRPQGGEGQAQLILSAASPTFSREKRLLFELLPPARVSLEGEGISPGLRLVPSAGVEAASLEVVSAELEQADGGRAPIPLAKHPEQGFQGTLDLSHLAGTAQVRVQVRARTPDGATLEAALPPLAVTGGLPAPAPPPVTPPAHGDHETPASAPAAPVEPPAAHEPASEGLGTLGLIGVIGGANLVLVLLGVGVWLLLRRRARKQAIQLVEDEEQAPAGKAAAPAGKGKDKGATQVREETP